MSCKWLNTDCENEGDKCYLCSSENFHYKPKKIKKTTFKKGKKSNRQGSAFEFNNHNNNQNMIENITTRMTPNSGAGKVKGDEEISGIINVMEELKTHEKKNDGRLPGTETFTIKKEWLLKLEKEAKAAGKEFYYLKFAFKNADSDHYIIIEASTIMDMIATMINDRKTAKEAEYKINVANKKAMLQEAEASKYYAENEYLKAKIEELEFQLNNKDR